MDGDSLAQFATVTTPSPATEICYSSDGAWIGAGGAGRHVIVIDVNNSYKVTRGLGEVHSLSKYVIYIVHLVR